MDFMVNSEPNATEEQVTGNTAIISRRMYAATFGHNASLAQRLLRGYRELAPFHNIIACRDSCPADRPRQPVTNVMLLLFSGGGQTLHR